MINIEELERKVLQINGKIAAGSSVQVNLYGAEDFVPLEIDKFNGVRKLLRARSKEIADNGLALDSFDIDLGDVEVSASDIAGKIKESSSEAVKDKSGKVPAVILTKPDNSRWWVLHETCSYTTNNGYTLIAPKGFLTDLASIPRVFWAIIASFELSLAAPVFHDLIYRYKGKLAEGQIIPGDKEFIRREADDIFLELMKETKVPEWKCTVAYWAVRGFAGFAWKQSNPTL